MTMNLGPSSKPPKVQGTSKKLPAPILIGDADQSVSGSFIAEADPNYDQDARPGIFQNLYASTMARITSVFSPKHDTEELKSPESRFEEAKSGRDLSALRSNPQNDSVDGLL